MAFCAAFSICCSRSRKCEFDCAFKVGPSERLTLHCRVDEVLEYSMGGDYRFFEGLASFQMGSRKGVGICELGRAERR